MSAQISKARLAELILIVEHELARIKACCGAQPQYSDEGYSFATVATWWKKHAEEIENSKRRLQTEGAVFTFKAAHEHAIRLGGFRSSSTTGWTGACRNWLIAARKRLHEEKVA